MWRLHWTAFSSQKEWVCQLTRFASRKWRSGLNRISHPDWVKLSVELNLRAKPKYEISLHYSITLTLKFIKHLTLLQYRQDGLLKRLKCRSGREDGSNLNRVETTYNRPRDFNSEKLSDGSNPRYLHIYRTFWRTKRLGEIKFGYCWSNITRDNVVWVSIPRKDISDFLKFPHQSYF